MQSYTIQYTHSATDIYFGTTFTDLKALASPENTFMITDEHLMVHYQEQLKPWRVICIPAGETSKSLAVLDDVIRQLIALEAGRDALIIGFGGGVITDIAGFAAGIYKRGVRCAFVPTSILAMVDAAIGGKNALDIGEYKNMIGLIRQPEFLCYDYSLLNSLPGEEWINGFAEIIKHACISDEDLFAQLEKCTIADFRNNETKLALLLRRNVLLKSGIVRQDETEKNKRKLLNFGHTLAHAIENRYELPHGPAVAVGMAFAAKLSEQETGFRQTENVLNLLIRYQLPVRFNFDPDHTLMTLLADKKRTGATIDFILLEQIGKGVIKPLSPDAIRSAFDLLL